jgi:HlyD family secretion protein
LTIIVLASLAYWFFIVRPAQAGGDELLASGTIEATQVRVNPEIGGRVLEVLAAKGDTVTAGDVLVKLDPALLTAQRDQAVAAVGVAQANADAAAANAEAAAAQVTAAESAQSAAQAALDAANANLALLEAGATDEQLAAANQQAMQAQANYQAALAGYAALTAGARPEDISVAQIRLDEARAAYYALTVTLDNTQIEDLRAVVSQGESNLTNAASRQSDLEGDNRTPQAILAALPASLADAQSAKDAAQAALDAGEDDAMPFYQQVEAARQSLNTANLILAQAKARQTALQNVDDITQAAKDALQAGVDDAQSVADAAKTAYDGLNNSDQAKQLKAAWDETQKALADLNKLARGGTTPLETVLYQLDAAESLANAAQANSDNIANGARPEQLAAAKAQVDAAQAQYDSAAANLSAAQSRTTAADAQSAAAAAQVTAAKAAVAVFDVQIAKLTLIAPADGVVLARSIEPGELAAPGAPLLVLADLGHLTITVYLPEDRYGEVTLGQEVTVSVDSFANQSFPATVALIAGKAEFTPRNVQTAEGRRTTVFAIELTIDNADGQLKPGMPADVKFK